MANPSFTNLLANGSTTDASSYVTASFTKTSGKPVLFTVHNSKGSSSATEPTLTVPSGVTATKIDTSQYDIDGSNIARRITVFWLTGAATGTVTIDFGGTTQTGAIWWASEVTDGDTAVPTHYIITNNSSSTPSANLTSVTAGNSVWAAVGVRSNTTVAAGSGFTLGATAVGLATPGSTLAAENRANSDNATPGFTLGSAVNSVVFAIEIPAVASQPPPSGTGTGWGIAV